MASLITTAYCFGRVQLRSVESRWAGNLREEDDIENNYNFCLKQLWEKSLTVTIIFRAWDEGWDEVQFNSTGDEKFAARYSTKYEVFM